jgi:hypothetical protein
MHKSRGFKIRWVTPIQHGRLHSLRTETKLMTRFGTSTRTCCAIVVAMHWRIRGTIPGSFKITSGTRVCSIRCGIRARRRLRVLRDQAMDMGGEPVTFLNQDLHIIHHQAEACLNQRRLQAP